MSAETCDLNSRNFDFVLQFSDSSVLSDSTEPNLPLFYSRDDISSALTCLVITYGSACLRLCSVTEYIIR